MARSKSKSKSNQFLLAYSAAGLGVLSVAALMPSYFGTLWAVPLSGAMRWYYGVVMVVTVAVAAWVVKRPRSDQAAGLLAVALLVVAIPGLQYVAGAYDDVASARSWMHLVATAGPLVVINVTAAAIAILAFLDLENH